LVVRSETKQGRRRSSDDWFQYGAVPRAPGDTRMMRRNLAAVNLSLQWLLEKKAENA
jgi:hypothetical protein